MQMSFGLFAGRIDALFAKLLQNLLTLTLANEPPLFERSILQLFGHISPIGQHCRNRIEGKEPEYAVGQPWRPALGDGRQQTLEALFRDIADTARRGHEIDLRQLWLGQIGERSLLEVRDAPLVDQAGFLGKGDGLPCPMSRSGNVRDNAAMESFFSSLNTERTARKVYRTRDDARADVFDYIERFYNPRRRHSTLGYLSPVEFEKRAMLA